MVTGGNVLIGGMPYTIAQNAFAPQNGDQENWLYGLGVKGRVGDWKLDANASAYDVTRDILRASNTASAGGPGTVFYGDGTGWSNFDLKAVSPTVSGHTVTTGYHYDQYHLRNQTFNASHWPTETLSTLKSSYQGDTRTQALFAQDAWAFAPRWLATLGLRYETWRADNGRLGNAGTTLGYAGRTEDAFSPKAALQWQATQDMLLRLSYGRAVRFPTVVELFQGSISGNTIVNNDPNLKPERANDLDFTVEQAVPSGMLRASLFQSDVRDSLYTQTNITVTPNVTSVQNVDRVRTRGIELAYSGRTWRAIWACAAWTSRPMPLSRKPGRWPMPPTRPMSARSGRACRACGPTCSPAGTRAPAGPSARGYAIRGGSTARSTTPTCCPRSMAAPAASSPWISRPATASTSMSRWRWASTT